ncbi:Dyp-type peroxidase [Thermaurantiacus sp.]
MSASAPICLERGDIQGGILRAYGKRGYPRARFLLFHVARAEAGRWFLEQLRPRVTPALDWAEGGESVKPGQMTRPEVTLNLAFTFRGLEALGVPLRTLKGFPEAFADGMAQRDAVLGDDVGPNRIRFWDPVWHGEPGRAGVHVLVMLNALIAAPDVMTARLAKVTAEVVGLAGETAGGVMLLEGHRGADPRWQELAALWGPQPDGRMGPLASEHFGFNDAIGDPVFDGQYPDGAERDKCRGQGAVDGCGNWRPLATGEFILGWPDESQEVAGAPMPLDFSRNGTFFAYRKLHQDLASWDVWIESRALMLKEVWGLASLAEARATLKAKMAGRWEDGVPLVKAPTFADWQAARARMAEMTRAEQTAFLTEFGYASDREGRMCPKTAHIRRANTRDALDPLWDAKDGKGRLGSALNNRRRILRRGLPYGGRDDPDGEHGIVLLAYCADLFRQFEFVQQQWMNHGLDFDAGNDGCPIVGAHREGARFVIASSDPAKPPFVAGGLKPFVTTRGGDYFFQPSMTALRMIGQGLVDPT